MCLEPDRRVSIVVLTHDRLDELSRCLSHLTALDGGYDIVVVDNGSRQPSAAPLRARFPTVRWVRSARNLGAAGRNLGVAAIATPYVAFCDDDTFWKPGALSRAAALLDAFPRVAAVGARVLIGEAQRRDPTCDAMAASPLSQEGLPGPRLISFMAGAVVMRAPAYREVGGYQPRLFIGAEETLLGLDLAARGWDMVYADDVVTVHHPSAMRDAPRRAWLLLRNRVWTAWLRLPVGLALRETWAALGAAAAVGLTAKLCMEALRGVVFVLRNRAVIPGHVASMYARVHRGRDPLSPASDPSRRAPRASSRAPSRVHGRSRRR